MRSSGKDKVQLLQVSEAQCAHDKSLTQMKVCDAVLKKLLAVAKGVTIPVKECVALTELRKATKELKQELLR